MKSPATKHIIAGLIQFARVKRGISRTQLATWLDISYQNVWDIENARQLVSCSYLDDIIALLGMTPVEFWALMPDYYQWLSKAKAA